MYSLNPLSLVFFKLLLSVFVNVQLADLFIIVVDALTQLITSPLVTELPPPASELISVTRVLRV